jgi:hypothetical protein
MSGTARPINLQQYMTAVKGDPKRTAIHDVDCAKIALCTGKVALQTTQPLPPLPVPDLSQLGFNGTCKVHEHSIAWCNAENKMYHITGGIAAQVKTLQDYVALQRKSEYHHLIQMFGNCDRVKTCTGESTKDDTTTTTPTPKSTDTKPSLPSSPAVAPDAVKSSSTPCGFAEHSVINCAADSKVYHINNGRPIPIDLTAYIALVQKNEWHRTISNVSCDKIQTCTGTKALPTTKTLPQIVVPNLSTYGFTGACKVHEHSIAYCEKEQTMWHITDGKANQVADLAAYVALQHKNPVHAKIQMMKDCTKVQTCTGAPAATTTTAGGSTLSDAIAPSSGKSTNSTSTTPSKTPTKTTTKTPTKQATTPTTKPTSTSTTTNQCEIPENTYVTCMRNGTRHYYKVTNQIATSLTPKDVFNLGDKAKFVSRGCGAIDRCTAAAKKV